MRTRTGPGSRSALLVLGLLLGSAAVQAQRAPTAADVTDSIRDLERALRLAVGVTTARENESRTLYLLIDATPSLKKAGFAAEFAHAIRVNANELVQTRIGVAVVGQSRLVVLSPTTDHARAVSAVEALLETPKNEIRNVYADIRRLAASFQGKGQRDIVLVTFENGDAEDAIESTVAHLENNRVRVTSIVRESYLADSYWIKRRRYWHDTRRIRLPKNCELIGGDGPFIDLPWGWVFQQTIVNEVVPSGFGVYGVTRLAAATGGRVFLYSPPAATKHKCAVYGRCLFCSGDHLPSGEAYASFKLSQFAPLAVSRKDAYRAVARDPYFRAVVTAWRAAAKAGVLQTTPMVQVAGTGARPDRNRGGAYLGFWDSLSFGRHARRAEEAAAACSRIIGKLEQAMRTAAKPGPSRTPGAGRQKAVAALTRVYLYLARTNLISFAGWCRQIAPSLVDKNRDDPAPPEIASLGKDQQAIRVTYHNMCLCHGVRPFLGVRLPGGKALRKELLMLDHVATEFMLEYRQSPYAVALHRAGIAHFSLVPGRRPPRARPSSKLQKGPLTSRSARGRPVRNPGATTGGAATGPTTGKRP